MTKTLKPQRFVKFKPIQLDKTEENRQFVKPTTHGPSSSLSNQGLNVENDKQDMVAPSGQMEKLDRIGKYGAICQARTNFT